MILYYMEAKIINIIQKQTNIIKILKSIKMLNILPTHF